MLLHVPVYVCVCVYVVEKNCTILACVYVCVLYKPIFAITCVALVGYQHCAPTYSTQYRPTYQQPYQCVQN